MSEQRNMILAIVLSVAILLGFQFLYPSDPAPEQTGGTLAGSADGATGGTLPQGSGSLTPVPGQLDARAGGGAVPGAGGVVDRKAAIAAETAERIRINTPRLHGSLRLRGARLDDLTLPDYRQTIDPTSPEIALLNPRNAANPYFVEFGWSPEDRTVTVPTADTLWQTNARELSPSSPVTLTWDNGAGLIFERTISVDENYMFTVEQKIRNTTSAPVTLYPYGLVSRHGTPQTSGFYILHEGLIGVLDDALKEVDYDKVQDEGSISTRSTNGGWIGITDKYWMTTLIPDQRAPFEGAFRHNFNSGIDKYQADYLASAVTVPAGGEAATTDRLFAGAKEVDLVDGYAERFQIELFDRAIDWGWFYFLTKPVFKGISALNSLLGNLGLATIAFTFILKFLFLPLAYKSYVSMNAMKELQPEMAKLKERFGEDRQRMQQEMMALYKKNKVNPVSGCLPILLQIPVFFSLYKVLFVTIEMRHAPFYGWIQDLSAPDPTNIFTLFGLIEWTPPELMHLGVWPLLMGLSMWLLQKMNPTPPDPVQAKIMMMLPIVFTFFLARFPAGLVLYWTTNNVLSIAQQYTIKRRMANRKAAKPAPKGAG